MYTYMYTYTQSMTVQSAMSRFGTCAVAITRESCPPTRCD